MATVKFTLEAEEAKAVQAFLRVVDAQSKTEHGFKRTTKAAQDQESLFAGLGGKIATLAAGYVSVQSAIDAATAALRFYNAEQDKGLNRARASEISLGSLSQLAGGDTAKMRQMVESAKATSQGAGIDLDRAAQLQFQLESFGIADQRELFANLYGTVADPGQLASAAVTARTAFGEKEAGSIRAILNKGLAASSLSKTTLEEMLSGISVAAPSMAQIGASDEQSLAAFAILSKARKAPEMAASEMQNLAQTMMRQGISGQGLFGGMDEIAKATAKMMDEERVKYFGSIEAMRGYATLRQEMPAIMSAYRDISAAGVAGQGNDAVAAAIRVRREVPELAATERLRQGEQRTEQARMDTLAVGRAGQMSMLEAIQEASLRRGEGSFRRWARGAAAETAQFLGASPETMLRAAAEMGVTDPNPTPTGLGAREVAEFSAQVKRLTGAVQKTGPMARNNGFVE